MKRPFLKFEFEKPGANPGAYRVSAAGAAGARSRGARAAGKASKRLAAERRLVAAANGRRV
jgi:hypothetical protein